MSSQGPLYPATISGSGTNNVWDNVALVGANDGTPASVTIELNDPDGGYSEIISCTNFGFTIPAGATINGVKAEIERWDGGVIGMQDFIVQLIKGGTPQGANKIGAAWPHAEGSPETYGGAADLWTLTLSGADINATNFGIRFQCVNGNFDSSGETAWVDYIRLTVYYTEASSIFSQTMTLMGVG